MAESGIGFNAILTMKVRPHEVMYLARGYSKAQEEGREADEVTGVVVLAKRGISPMRSVCLIQRMLCLKSMFKDERMIALQMKTDEDGRTLISRSAFVATARAPLHMHEKNLYFEPDEFFEIALKTRGQS